MLPFMQEHFANPGSTTHSAGRWVREQVDSACARIANAVGAEADELVITSGATEANNLAILGTCLHPRQKRRKVICLASEHKAVLDPIRRLGNSGFNVLLLDVTQQPSPASGKVDISRLEAELDDETALVSVMLANNEIGVIQPIQQIAELCEKHGVILHTDAAQAVGNLPVNVADLGADLVSFSSHKFYGPKGVGGLIVRSKNRRVRLLPQIVGGGQQNNLRSGTLNAPGIIGTAAALELCLNDLHDTLQSLGEMRNNLFELLSSKIEGVTLNGPSLVAGGDSSQFARLPGNLNCSFAGVEGQSLMLELPQLAVSSGSACTSAEPEPSHVLLALGLSQDQARSSLRFGIGRTTTQEQIEQTASWVSEAVGRLRKFI